MRAVRAAVPIFIATTMSLTLASSAFFSLRPLFCISSRPTILRPRHSPSCSYIVAAARLVNIITLGFYFHDFFYIQPRMSVYLPLPLLAIAVAFYDPVAFSLSRCVKLLGNTNSAAPVSLLVLSFCRYASARYSRQTIRTSMWLNNSWILSYCISLTSLGSWWKSSPLF